MGTKCFYIDQMLYADDIFLFLSAIFSGLSVDRTFLKADGLHICIFCLIGCITKKNSVRYQLLVIEFA